MSTVPKYEIDFMIEGQSGGELLYNEYLIKMDAMVQMVVLDDDLSTPPGSPSDGDLYIVMPTGVGLWADHDNELALYHGGWIFIVVKQGMMMWLADESIFRVFNGTTWQNI